MKSKKKFLNDFRAKKLFEVSLHLRKHQASVKTGSARLEAKVKNLSLAYRPEVYDLDKKANPKIR